MGRGCEQGRHTIGDDVVFAESMFATNSFPEFLTALDRPFLI